MLALAASNVGYAAARDAGGRPFSIDDMLAISTITDIKYGAGGDVLVVVSGRHDAKSDFGEGWSGAGTIRHFMRLPDGAFAERGPQPLGAQDRLWSLSPNREIMAVVSRAGAQRMVRVGSPGNHNPFQFDITPSEYLRPTWVRDRYLLLGVLQPSLRPLDAYTAPGAVDPVAVLEAQRAGLVATASPIGSGRYRADSPDRVGDGLALIDARLGSIARFGKGLYFDAIPSPSGRLIATTRGSGIEHLNADGIVPRSDGSLWRKTLTLLDLDTGVEMAVLDANIDVLPGSLVWSPDGRRVAFFGRLSGQPWSSGTYRVLDARSQRVLATSAPALAEGFKPRAMFLGETLFVSVSSVSQAESWKSVDSDRVDLLRLFSGGSAQVASIVGDECLVLSGRKIWSVDRRGNRRLVNAVDIHGTLRVMEVPQYSGESTQPHEGFALQAWSATDDNEPALRAVILFSRHGALRHTIRAPSPTAQVLAVDIAGGQAAFLDYHRGYGRLQSCNSRTCGQLIALNNHLADVARGQRLRLRYLASDSRETISWLLLPPHYDRHRALPTIVAQYPGTSWSRAGAELQDFPAYTYNLELFAANGYAVLFASVPLQRQAHGGLANSISDALDRAIDAAQETGLVDAERLAIYGHSFGAYGTMAVVSRSNRYRAAIAIDGVYDLISMYGTFEPRARYAAEMYGLRTTYTLGWTEAGQGQMGVAPWIDLSRYTENSPVLHAHRIATPVLLFAGDRSQISMTQSEEMFSALYRQGRDAQFVRYFGEGHAPLSPANIRDLYRRMLAFLEDNLAAEVNAEIKEVKDIHK